VQIKILLAILIIVAIAVGGIFYNDYSSQSVKAESVNAEIRNDKNANTIVTRSIQNTNSEIAEIARKIDGIKEDLEREEDQLPARIDSNEIVKDIILRGKACEVTAIPLSTQEWTKTQINKINYQVLKIKLEIKGRQMNVLNFISEMQSPACETLLIENITLRKANDPLDTDIIADINLAIYTK
jgi:Tfp pilus assembly protein PilO